jgi:hypothetical protein
VRKEADLRAVAYSGNQNTTDETKQKTPKIPDDKVNG